MLGTKDPPRRSCRLLCRAHCYRRVACGESGTGVLDVSGGAVISGNGISGTVTVTSGTWSNGSVGTIDSRKIEKPDDSGRV